MGRAFGKSPIPFTSRSFTRITCLTQTDFPQTMVIVKIPDSSHDGDEEEILLKITSQEEKADERDTKR